MDVEALLDGPQEHLVLRDDRVDPRFDLTVVTQHALCDEGARRRLNRDDGTYAYRTYRKNFGRLTAVGPSTLTFPAIGSFLQQTLRTKHSENSDSVTFSVDVRLPAITMRA